MKKSNIILLILLFLFVLNTNAQNPPADKVSLEILQKASRKIKNYSNFELFFNIQIIGNEINEKQAGVLVSEGKKFNLKIKGQTVYCDGENVWTVIEESEEVQITTLDENEISPNNLFTLYEKGFNSKIKSQTDSKVTIALYPKNPRTQTYHRIEIIINKQTNEIIVMKVLGKDGTNTIYNLKSMKKNISFPKNFFTFDSKKAKDFEIIDLR